MTRRALALLVLLVAATAVPAADDGPAPPAPPPAAKRAPHVTVAPFGCVWEDLAAARAASEKDGRPVILYFTFDG